MRYAFFQLERDSGNHEINLIGLLGNFLVNQPAEIAEPPGRRVIGNNPQAHLVADNNQRTARAPAGLTQSLALLEKLLFGPTGHQAVGDPEGQTID